MTREERIFHLKMLKSRITVFDEEDNKQIRALQETIQALEQQSCDHPDKCHECEKILTCTYYKQEPNGDLISRQAINDLQKYRYNCGDTSIICVSLSSINELPSVKPQEQTGHWIEKYDNLYVCSECGQYIYSETEHDLLEFHAFCGRCGAKMVEPQESEEVCQEKKQ